MLSKLRRIKMAKSKVFQITRRINMTKKQTQLLNGTAYGYVKMSDGELLSFDGSTGDLRKLIRAVESGENIETIDPENSLEKEANVLVVFGEPDGGKRNERGFYSAKNLQKFITTFFPVKTKVDVKNEEKLHNWYTDVWNKKMAIADEPDWVFVDELVALFGRRVVNEVMKGRGV
jgi:hypothetical protein